MADPFKDTRDPLARSLERAGHERTNAAWHQAREDLRDLAQHLRRCRECGETDIQQCAEGWPLWLKCFPNDAKGKPLA